MAQTTLSYNELFQGAFGMPARTKVGTLTASLGALAAGTILVLDPATNKYIKWDSSAVTVVTASGTPDTTTSISTTKTVGLAILLEAKTVTTETTGLLGISGEINAADLVLAGSTITTVTEFVKAVLQLNGIFVKTGSNALNVAGA